MNYKNILYIVLLVSLIVANVNAELPYESDHKHSIVVTGGMKWDKPLNDKLQNIFTMSYSYDNKISGGISYRDYKSDSIAVYDGTGYADSTGFINSQAGSGVVQNNSSYYRDIQYNHYINLYAQVKPLNLLNIEAPITFSFFVALQDVSDGKNFIATGYFYKKFILYNKHSIQPIISIGYRDISREIHSRRGKYGCAIIYSYALNNHTSILISPQVNKYWKHSSYTVQAGISHGFGI